VERLEPVSGAPNDVAPVSGAAPSVDPVVDSAPPSPAEAGRHGQHETAPTSPAPGPFVAPAVPMAYPAAPPRVVSGPMMGMPHPRPAYGPVPGRIPSPGPAPRPGAIPPPRVPPGPQPPGMPGPHVAPGVPWSGTPAPGATAPATSDPAAAPGTKGPEGPGAPGAPPNAGPFAAAPTASAPFNNVQADQLAWTPAAPRTSRRLNNAALAAMIVSLASFVTCPLIGLVGVYLGLRAKKEIQETGDDGDGMASAGVVVGFISTGVAAVTVLVVAMVVAFAAGAASN